jgi:hypothetical protein
LKTQRTARLPRREDLAELEAEARRQIEREKRLLNLD